MKFHREAREVPTEAAERRVLIRWLLAHKMWTYPYTHRMAPDGQLHFEATEDPRLQRLVTDGPDWVDEVVDMGGFEANVVQSRRVREERIEKMGGVFRRSCVPITIEFVYVNPLTERIEDDETSNTTFRVWLEAGPYEDRKGWPGETEPEEGWNDHNRWMATHDIRLDCGGPDAETALCELAVRVELLYGEGRDDRDDPPKWRCQGTFKGEEYTSGCTDAGNGYCERCGFRVKGN